MQPNRGEDTLFHTGQPGWPLEKVAATLVADRVGSVPVTTMSSKRIPNRLAGWLALAIVGGLAFSGGCRKSDTSKEAPAPAAPPADSDAPPKPVQEVALPPRVNIAAPMEDLDRWLTVEAIRGDAPGAWAEGSFNPKSNKIIIDTHDVQRFALEVSRIPIRWEKLVIIRIDGRNSEMVRRDQAIYHFDLDDHGQWVVLGP